LCGAGRIAAAACPDRDSRLASCRPGVGVLHAVIRSQQALLGSGCDGRPGQQVGLVL